MRFFLSFGFVIEILQCGLIILPVVLGFFNINLREIWVLFLRRFCAFLGAKVSSRRIFLCNFCRTFQCNFCRARARDKNCKCKLAAISVRFVAAISQRFRICSKLDATWRRFGENCSKYRTGIAVKSLLVYTCDKSCIGKRDKICTKNRMCKRAFRVSKFKTTDKISW